jgi:hypothetical protein
MRPAASVRERPAASVRDAAANGDAATMRGVGGGASLLPVLGLCAMPFVFVVWIEMEKARGSARIIYPGAFSLSW